MKKIYFVTLVNGEKARKEKITANSKRDKVISSLKKEGDEIVKIEDITPDVNAIIEKINASEILTLDEKEVIIKSL